MEPVVTTRLPHQRSAMKKFLPSTVTALLLLASGLSHALEVSVDGRDFQPYINGATYAESSAGNLTCTGSANLFMAQLPLPAHSIELDLKQLAIWGGDVSSNNATVKLIKYCQAEFTPSTPVTTILADVSSSGNSGNYYSAQAMNLRVDDQGTCVYTLLAELGFNTCGGSALSLGRVRVRYDLVQPVVVDPIFKNGFEN